MVDDQHSTVCLAVIIDNVLYIWKRENGEIFCFAYQTSPFFNLFMFFFWIPRADSDIQQARIFFVVGCFFYIFFCFHKNFFSFCFFFFFWNPMILINDDYSVCFTMSVCVCVGVKIMRINC